MSIILKYFKDFLTWKKSLNSELIYLHVCLTKSYVYIYILYILPFTDILTGLSKTYISGLTKAQKFCNYFQDIHQRWKLNSGAGTFKNCIGCIYNIYKLTQILINETTLFELDWLSQ